MNGSNSIASASQKAGSGRHVLLLQGPSSPFMAHVGDALRERGAKVSRIHLSPGDWLMWRGGGDVFYRGSQDNWRDFVAAYASEHGVTDLICLSSARRYHKDAIAALRAQDVRVTVIEHGYIRPGYLLAEPGGTGGDSQFPRTRADIEALADADMPLPPPLAPGRAGSFALYAALDVAWNLSNVFLTPIMTPGYRRHALDHPFREYSGWLRKLATGKRRRRAADTVMTAIANASGRVFLFPLQLETDFQIRSYGTGWSLREELEQLVVNFASNAPPDAMLVVKAHPLDNDAAPWAHRVTSMAWRQGVEDRVLFADGGDLDQMLDAAAGVVTINSTVGLTAVLGGTPVLALGEAVYNLPGITHSGEVDGFWQAPQPPDSAYVEALRLALLKTVHVGGSFDGAGMAEGAAGVADKALMPPPFGPLGEVKR